jgi:outer membrane protein OmpA-like peptidoglycan-associated protein
MNKKLLISLLIILLPGWIAGCAYWYVCKSRKSSEIKIANNCYSIINDKHTNSVLEISEIKEPVFLISDGNIIISESLSNISFISGTADIKIPDSMETEFNKLATYLKNNPNKNLKITGLYSNTDNSDSLGIARANSMVNYFKTNKGISTDRMITSSSASKGLYQKIMGGIEYEIISKTEQIAIEEAVIAPRNIDPSLKRKVKRRQTMYYPLTHFEIDPTYALEKYFKNLNKYFEQNPEGLVQITGHTTTKGDNSLSKYYSKKYAEKVKKYLISEYKMNPRNFRIKGRGDTRPVTSSDTDLGRAKNRRIEFSFIK